MKVCLQICVLLAAIVSLPSISNAETTFFAYLKVDGLSVCVMDTAVLEELSARSEIDCGIKCLARPSCSVFTYRRRTAKCGLYDNQPKSLEPVEGCASYVLRMTPITSRHTVETEIGSNVTLDCRQFSRNIRWSFTPRGSQVTSVIVKNCQLADGYQNRYAAESFDSQCRLSMLSISSAEAGNYECQDSLFPVYPPTVSVLTTLIVCPSGFKYLSSGSCYKVLIAAMNWAAANASCAQLYPRSHLATISDDAEQSAIAEFLAVKLNDTSSDICLYRSNSRVGKFIWIGARVLDLATCQPFVWFLSSGETSPLNYTNWMLDQPSCTSSRPEQCVHLRMKSNFMWNDVYCVDRICALCEHDP